MLKVPYFMVTVQEQWTLQTSFNGARKFSSSDSLFAKSLFRHWLWILFSRWLRTQICVSRGVILNFCERKYLEKQIHWTALQLHWNWFHGWQFSLPRWWITPKKNKYYWLRERKHLYSKSASWSRLSWVVPLLLQNILHIGLICIKILYFNDCANRQLNSKHIYFILCVLKGIIMCLT